MKKNVLLVLLFCTALATYAQRNVTITSPDHRLSCNISIGKNNIFYEVYFNRKKVIDRSALSLEFASKAFFADVKALKPVYKDTTEKYTLMIGKAKDVIEAYKEVSIPLVSKGSTAKVNVVFRMFNDAAAFRYVMTGPADSFAITDERAEFRLTGNPTAKVLQLPNYTSSHEGFYTTAKLNSLQQDTLMDMPALFYYDDNVFVSITEAALLDYAGMYLIKKNNVLSSTLSPLPKQPDVKVKGVLPHLSPWRVILISDKPGDLIVSNVLTTLSPPNRIHDTSWIKPGKTTFPWWNGNIVPDTLNAPGNNFVTQQYHIDFCARNNIAYHSVVEYGLHQWYTDDGVGFQPGPNADVTKPVPGLDMKEVCDYARSKGVGVRVWVHFYALYPKLDSAFAIFEKWGLAGMMVDFMDRDDQEMVNMQTEILEKAAKHKLHIQFHGAYKPTGLSRTYPNEFTREGTLNYETNKWGPGLPAKHDLDIAFTRLIAGSTDYHLGGFRAVPDEKYITQYSRPLMLGTRSHMLALYVVYENAQSMVCDYPAAYEGQEGFDFIKEVPTTWDESKVPDAKPDQYMVVARRKDNDWYLGAINNSQKRQLSVPLSFLGDAKYIAEIYEDHEKSAEDPNRVNIRKETVSGNDTLTIHLAAGGGVAVQFKKR